jgi:hypothetical protein
MVSALRRDPASQRQAISRKPVDTVHRGEPGGRPAPLSSRTLPVPFPSATVAASVASLIPNGCAASRQPRECRPSAGMNIALVLTPPPRMTSRGEEPLDVVQVLVQPRRVLAPLQPFSFARARRRPPPATRRRPRSTGGPAQVRHQRRRRTGASDAGAEVKQPTPFSPRPLPNSSRRRRQRRRR